MIITLEAGKRYVNRSGWITPPLQALTHDVFKFGITSDIVVMHSWMADGTAPYGQKGEDLVAEVEAQQ